VPAKLKVRHYVDHVPERGVYILSPFHSGSRRPFSVDQLARSRPFAIVNDFFCCIFNDASIGMKVLPNGIVDVLVVLSKRRVVDCQCTGMMLRCRPCSLDL
jgi:hypothetical protein